MVGVNILTTGLLPPPLPMVGNPTALTPFGVAPDLLLPSGVTLVRAQCHATYTSLQIRNFEHRTLTQPVTVLIISCNICLYLIKSLTTHTDLL